MSGAANRLRNLVGQLGSTDGTNNQNVSRNSRIAIVGGGVFGISTALHLARRGYSDITVFDRDDLENTSYSVASGCSGASADENKVVRASYGEAKLYEDLAFKAVDEWNRWNDDIAKSQTHPRGLTQQDRVWYNCGFLRASEGGLDSHEQSTQNSLPQHLRWTQYRVSDDQRINDAIKDNVAAARLDPWERKKRGLPYDGILDMTGGFVRASLSCSWALHRCRELGVKFVLGEPGKVAELLYNSDKVVGLKTEEGNSYLADLVVVAGGGWTPALLPKTSTILQTTAGSLITIKIPQNRHDLLKKYSPEQFPTWSWRMDKFKKAGSTEVGSIYGFPADFEGKVKIGFRGTKFTHYTSHFDASGRPISFPTTEKQGIPKTAMNTIKEFCAENFPDLFPLGVSSTRLCWYTDAIYNSFLIDWVPETSGLLVASGGSGHGFKFLPVLGEKVADRIEGKLNPAYSELFGWRPMKQEQVNGPSSGPNAGGTLEEQELVVDWNYA